ncbi:hypothetical protein ACTWPT_28560 [Nonomuraea sp. 3N208]|uniref:hypothetical protein n=1 Tax=Nonomuraea sp. 3N208 TaxID=3457421 RepID=UPI003FCF421D
MVGVIERESGCQPVDRGWPEYALTDLDFRPLGRCDADLAVADKNQVHPTWGRKVSAGAAMAVLSAVTMRSMPQLDALGQVTLSHWAGSTEVLGAGRPQAARWRAQARG